jgi:hypothetical protein
MAVAAFGLKKNIKNFVKKKIFIYNFYHFNPYYEYLSRRNLIFVLHFSYLVLASFINLFIKIKKDKVTNFFKKNGFYKRILKKNEFPYELFEYLNNDLENKKRIPIVCHLDNYTFHNKVTLVDSQQHVYDIPELIMDKLDQYLRKDKYFNNLIKFYFKTNYRITNLRLWRYLANSQKNLKSEVGCHYDMFPHKTLKIMIYKGFFLSSHGALDIVDPETGNLIYSIKGKDPIVLLDTNHLYHGAKFPLKNRDTIEITIQPSIRIKKPLYGGFAAGHPKNPFMSNKKTEILFKNI